MEKRAENGSNDSHSHHLAEGSEPMKSKPPDQRTGHPRTAKAVELVGPAVEIPEPPAHLGTVGRMVWYEVWEIGAPGGAYQLSDRLVIERYAVLQERREAFLDTIAMDGWTTLGKFCAGVRTCVIHWLSLFWSRFLSVDNFSCLLLINKVTKPRSSSNQNRVFDRIHLLS